MKLNRLVSNQIYSTWIWNYNQLRALLKKNYKEWLDIGHLLEFWNKNHSKIPVCADRKMPRSGMGKCNFPVSDQLLVQLGQILPVSDKNLSKLDQKLGWNRKISFFHFGPRHFPVGAPKLFLSVYHHNKYIRSFRNIL